MLLKGGLKGFNVSLIKRKDDIRVLKDSLKRFKHQILATFQPYFLDILVFFINTELTLSTISIIIYQSNQL